MCFEFKRLIWPDGNIQQTEVFFTFTNAKISIDILHSICFNNYENFTFILLLDTIFKEHLQNEGWCSNFTQSTMTDVTDDTYPHFSTFEYIKHSEVD